MKCRTRRSGPVDGGAGGRESERASQRGGETGRESANTRWSGESERARDLVLHGLALPVHHREAAERRREQRARDGDDGGGGEAAAAARVALRGAGRSRREGTV